MTAYFEHENGMVGHFITSTGESPGTNRLEIVGEYGKLVYESLPAAPEPAARPRQPDDLVFYRNARSSIEEIRSSPKGFDKAPFRREVVDYEPRQSHGHDRVIENFAAAILAGAPLIAPAEEGIKQVLLSNAIMLSAHKGATLDLPIDGAEYAALLERYIAAAAG